MAVRMQNIHDGGIMERRLRPIYDWLDHGNNKKALQEAEKVLKKSPSLQAARALKALSLFRLGKGPEAQSVLDALAEEKPSDDTTLQAMTISYRESQQLPKVCALYEAAVKAEPISEELHSHLFMSYVRVRDYHAQQRAAMALYKFAPKNPYYFWAVMSIVLQAKATEDSTKRGILLTLAQRMIDNFISENKMEAEQEAQLYIMILELKDKWDDILKFIEGPLYSQLVPGSNIQTCIPYLKKLGHWKRLNSICKELLLDNPDRWDFYLPYFDSVFYLLKEGGNYENIDDTAEKCHEFICQLVEGMSSGKTLRGPYLARLELWRRLAEAGEDTSLLGSGVALCVQYLRVFAHKPCAVPDLRTYLEMIPQKDREENSRDFLTCLEFDENSEPETTDDIQRHISCLSAWRITAVPLNAEDCLTLATTFRRHYLRSLHQGLVTATVTEFCAPDGYGLLAAHHCFFAATQLSSNAPLVEAACILELVLHHSPSNFHAKLLLVRLYHLLGNALAADSIYQRLEVKHIQLLSLGWLHTAALGTGCAFTRSLQLLADTNAFHTHHAKDSVEHLTYAYKYGTFSSLVSLYDWNERLECCAFSALCSRERALFALLAGPLTVNANPQLRTNLRDNRDLNVIVNWEPPQLYDKNLKSRTFEEDLALLRLKDGLVSSVSLCVEMSESRPQEEKRQRYDELVVCLDAFGSAMDKCKERYCERGKISLSTPFPSRLVAFVNCKVPYRELYTSTLRLVGEVCMSHTDEIHELCERLSEVGGGIEVEGSGRDGLEEMSMVLEYIGVVTLALGLCNDIAKSTGAKKSKRKTNQSPADLKTIQLLNKLNGSTQKLISDIEKVFKNWPLEEFTPTLETEMSKMFNNKKYQSPVLLKLKNGHNDMVNDVKNILNKKTKYLKSLQ